MQTRRPYQYWDFSNHARSIQLIEIINIDNSFCNFSSEFSFLQVNKHPANPMRCKKNNRGQPVRATDESCQIAGSQFNMGFSVHHSDPAASVSELKQMLFTLGD